jgi:hypothetical protein
MNMAIDFSGYSGDLIRAGTVVAVQMHIQYGDATDGVLTFTKDRSAEMLKAEFTVLEGEFARRKIFTNWIVIGSTDGQKSIAERYLATLKRIIASAFFLDPNDRSPETLAKYKKEWRDFDGLKCLVEIGVEPGRDGYEDKNTIGRIIRRDTPAWGGRLPFEQDPSLGGTSSGSTRGAQATSPATPAATPIQKPAWAS